MGEGQLVIPSETAAELSRLGIPVWTRRDGTTINLDDMQDRHIQSVLAILLPWRRDCRKRAEAEMAETLHQTIKMLKLEQRRRVRLEKRTLSRRPKLG